MEDRELLEMAAKAAGIKFEWRKGPVFYGPRDMYGVRQSKIVELSWLLSGRGEWNPLKSDGDALRLAVKLNIHISLYGPDTGMNAWIVRDVAESFDEDYGDDPCASVRRAITRAAAEIGRSMP